MLEPLGPAARAALDRHNREALRQLVAYVERYVAGLGLDGGAAARADEALPLSGVRVPLMARSAEGANSGEQAGGGLGIFCGMFPGVGMAGMRQSQPCTKAGKPPEGRPPPRLQTVPAGAAGGGTAAASPALLSLLASAPPVPATVCSPYAALSGRGDDFSSMDDLVRSLCSGCCWP